VCHPGQASNNEREPGSSNPACAMRTNRGYWIPAFAGMTGVCVLAWASSRLCGDDRRGCVLALADLKQTPEVIPAKRATASVSRDPVTPTRAIRTDRDYWIPAFAGMTGVNCRATHVTTTGDSINPSAFVPLVPGKAGTQRAKFLTQCVALDSRWSLPPRRRGWG
jgi:hypothetical protein